MFCECTSAFLLYQNINERTCIGIRANVGLKRHQATDDQAKTIWTGIFSNIYW